MLTRSVDSAQKVSSLFKYLGDCLKKNFFFIPSIPTVTSSRLLFPGIFFHHFIYQNGFWMFWDCVICLMEIYILSTLACFTS